MNWIIEVEILDKSYRRVGNAMWVVVRRQRKSTAVMMARVAVRRRSAAVMIKGYTVRAVGASQFDDEIIEAVPSDMEKE